jgi:hypothetical protein
MLPAPGASVSDRQTSLGVSYSVDLARFLYPPPSTIYLHYDGNAYDGTFSRAVLAPFASNALFSVVFAAAAASFVRHDLMAHSDATNKQPTKTAITGGKGTEHSPSAFITGPDSQIAERSAPSCA